MKTILLSDNTIDLTFIPMGMGLTADESTIVFVDANKNAHQLPLYSDQDCQEIDFIEKEANIVQLYEMLELRKNVKDFGKKTYFVTAMKSYIQEQQKTVENK
jgi:hypothetical protein